MNIRKRYLGALLLASASLAAVSFSKFPAKIIYNPSPSAPIGFYKINDRSVYHVGDFVAANLSNEAANLAFNRRYLPKNIPVLKTIYALGDDEICIDSHSVLVNNKPVGRIQTEDSLGRPMTVLRGCYHLQNREYFLLSTAIENSFDSRYFGPVDEANILGVATPLLIFSE